jgi:hypothetical protein
MNPHLYRSSFSPFVHMEKSMKRTTYGTMIIGCSLQSTTIPLNAKILFQPHVAAQTTSATVIIAFSLQSTTVPLNVEILFQSYIAVLLHPQSSASSFAPITSPLCTSMNCCLCCNLF